jgi:succinoglycan biosynthesis transport protein ExoP
MSMLQISKPSAVEDSGAEVYRRTEPDAASAAALIEALLRVVRRQYATFTFVTVLTIALGVLYLYVTPLTFKAEATLLIDRGKFLEQPKQQLFVDAPVDAASVESEIEILKSDNIARAVIKKLHLTDDPEFLAPSGVVGRLISVVSSVVNFLNPTPPTPAGSEADVVQSAVPTFKGRLDAQRVGGSFIIAVTFKSHNAERAAQIANMTVDAYINNQLQAKFEATHRANLWLQNRLNDLATQTAAADKALADFKAKHNVVSTGTGKSQTELLISDRNTRLLEAQAQVTAAQARLDQIEGIFAKNDALDDTTTFATVAETLTNPVVVHLRTKYLDLVNREVDWSKRFGANHLAVVNLRTQIHEIRDSILSELKQIAETYKSDLAIAKGRQEALEKALTEAASQSNEDSQVQSVLADLESAAKSRHALYDDLQQRYMQSLPTESFAVSDARLVTAATVQLEKTTPKPLLVLALAALGGLAIGGGIGLLREMFDRVFRTREQIEHALQTTCIALVPALENGATSNSASSPPEQTSGLAPEGPRDIVRKSNIIWSVSDSPFSRFSEAIRSLKLAVDLNRMDRPHNTVGFTSAIPNEGKTTIAASFALLTAQVGARVILVDSDFRNPVLSRTLTPNASCGILEVISGESSLEKVVWMDPSTHMTFLPAFVPFRLPHSSEILSSDRMARLFEVLRQSYDYVVIDLPPLAPIVDVRATKRIVDTYLLVVQWGRTKIPVIETALGEAPGVYENLLGVVLNKVDMNVARRYDGHLKDYYRNKHFSRYGYVD